MNATVTVSQHGDFQLDVTVVVPTVEYAPGRHTPRQFVDFTILRSQAYQLLMAAEGRHQEQVRETTRHSEITFDPKTKTLTVTVFTTRVLIETTFSSDVTSTIFEELREAYLEPVS